MKYKSYVFLLFVLSFTLFGETNDIQCSESEKVNFEAKKSLCENKKDMKICDSLANYYQVGLCTNIDKNKAIELRKYVCNQGYSKACFDLSFQLDDLHKYDEATIALHQACKISSNYCTTLAFRYLSSSKIEKNYFKAKEIFEKRCNENDKTSCYVLGTMYEEGQGTRQDYRKAKILYGKACDLKDNDGCTNYSRLNKNGY